jgi:uncharacterized protein (UPF0305 family)
VKTGEGENDGLIPSKGSQREEECRVLAALKTRGELGRHIAWIVPAYSPRDLQKMRGKFSGKVTGLGPRYRRHLGETITGFLHGTYQTILLMGQQRAFSSMDGKAVSRESPACWRMVATHCRTGDDEGDRLRYLKFLIAGFCMLVPEVPGHPVGMEFPGQALSGPVASGYVEDQGLTESVPVRKKTCPMKEGSGRCRGSEN